jgi:hypothetical protein
MTRLPLEAFAEVPVVDFEYRHLPGGVPEVHCVAVTEFHSGRTIRLWRDQLVRLKRPPYPIGPGAIFVCYSGLAELQCHLSLGWDLPYFVLDLLPEFRMIVNGTDWREGEKSRHKLIHALQFFRLDTIDAVEKRDMQDLALRGGPYSSQERQALLDYCGRDVRATAQLLPAMAPQIPLQALQRGRFVKTAAKMVYAGIPVNVSDLTAVQEGRGAVIRALTSEVPPEINVYRDGVFKDELHEAVVERYDLAWPRKPAGCLDRQGPTWDKMAAAYPFLMPLRQCVREVQLLRANEVAAGPDGRSRYRFFPFGSSSGRNAWAAAEFIPAQPSFFRGVIQPPPRRAIANLDYAGQEILVDAVQSGDRVLLGDYYSEDIYDTYGRKTGLIRPGMPARVVEDLRKKVVKPAFLGLMYDRGPWGLSEGLGIPLDYAEEMFKAFHREYSVHTAWAKATRERALVDGFQETLMGWRITVRAGDVRKGPDEWRKLFNPRQAVNFKVQGGAADVSRLACNYVSEAGITLLACVHDSLLVESDERDIDAVADAAEAFMVRAGQELLDGARLKVKRQIVRHPGRLLDSASEKARWDWLMLRLSQTRLRAGMVGVGL